jgi:hypothetical protein
MSRVECQSQLVLQHRENTSRIPVSRKRKNRKNGPAVVYKLSELPPSNAAAALEPELAPGGPLLSLEEVRKQASEYASKGLLEKLLELAAMPLAHFAPNERYDARVQLLRTKVWALAKGELDAWHSVDKADRQPLQDSMRELDGLMDDFHQMPEFALYYRSFGYTVADALQGFEVMDRACRQPLDFNWVERFRSFGLRLMNPDAWAADDELTDAIRAQIAKLPDIDLTLKQAYARAGDIPNLEPDDRLRLQLFRIELDLMTAEPWDFDTIRRSLADVPSPSPSDLEKTGEMDGPWASLTPRGWGFLWELSMTPGSEFKALASRYPDGFGSDLCDGLAHFLRSINSDGPAIDTHFVQAMTCLTRYVDSGEHSMGSSMVVASPEGSKALPFGYSDIQCPDAPGLILRLAERAPAGYPRREELLAFYTLYDVASAYGSLESSSNLESKEFVWLCKQNIQFQWLVANTVENPFEFAVLAVGALIRAADSASPLRGHLNHIPDEKLTPDDTEQVLDILEDFSTKRSLLDDATAKLWQSAAAGIFQMLDGSKRESLEKSLVLARKFAADLATPDGLFLLGYLEQVAGSPAAALSAYLESLRLRKTPGESLTSNVKLLCAKATDLPVVEELIERLRDFVKTGVHADTVNGLLREAEKRLKPLRSKDQFERTAVNRWPSLTAPARKVLSVLHQIQGYHGFDELGRYAGMDAVWAERHYNKLVEEGMVLESKDSWKINPHIVPLLERESQHAVIGRIVRGTGTNAVKQVFNSQREFSIYQILVQLCPNHMVFPNCSLQSIMSFDRMKELVEDEDFGYYLRASVDIVVVSTTTYLPMLAIEVDSVWHDTEKQLAKDERKDRLFATAGIPFLRLRPVGSPSETVIRGQVAEHLGELVDTLREDIPGYDQARRLLEDLSGLTQAPKPGSRAG